MRSTLLLLLRRRLHQRLHVVTDVWNASRLAALSRYVTSTAGTFLSLHKSFDLSIARQNRKAGSTAEFASLTAFEAARAAIVLSAGGQLISQTSHPLDEDAYRGCVLFPPSSGPREHRHQEQQHHHQARQLGSKSAPSSGAQTVQYQQLVTLSDALVQLIDSTSNSDGPPRRNQTPSTVDRFRSHFEPAAIMQRAAIGINASTAAICTSISILFRVVRPRPSGFDSVPQQEP